MADDFLYVFPSSPYTFTIQTSDGNAAARRRQLQDLYREMRKMRADDGHRRASDSESDEGRASWAVWNGWKVGCFARKGGLFHEIFFEVSQGFILRIWDFLRFHKISWDFIRFQKSWGIQGVIKCFYGYCCTYWSWSLCLLTGILIFWRSWTFGQRLGPKTTAGSVYFPAIVWWPEGNHTGYHVGKTMP